MTKFIKSTLAVFLTVFMLFATLVPCFADEVKEAKAGSTLEYTLSIADSEQNITGIHLELYFDTNVMTIKDIKADNLEGAVINDNINNDGRITVVNGLINGSRGLECKEKTDLITVTFDVIADGNTEVQYYIPYLYDYNLTSLYRYTLTENVVIDGEVAVENQPPVLADPDILAENIKDFDRGDFVNNEDGKAEGTAPVGQTQPVTVTAPSEYKTLEYTFYVADAIQKLSNIKVSFIYNNNIMQIDKVTSDFFDSTSVNYDRNNEGLVVVNAEFESDKAPVISDNTAIVTLSFKVFGDGDTTIKYFVNQMDDTDDVIFYTYTFTDKTVLDGEVISEGKAPILAGDEDLAAFKTYEKGNFLNSESGIGSGIKPGSNNADDSDEGKKSNTLVIVCIVAVVIVGAIVALAIVKSKKSGDDESEEEKEKDTD